MFDALGRHVPGPGTGAAPCRTSIARVARLRFKRAPALAAAGCALLIPLTACGDTGTKPAPHSQASATAPATQPTTSAAPAPSPPSQTTAPAPPPPPETTPPAASPQPETTPPSPPPETTQPPAPETTAAPQQHSGTIRGGEFCRQDEEGTIGFDASGDAYICQDVDHDGHPHWVKLSAAPVPAPSPSQADASDVVQRYYAAINAEDYATAWALGGQNLVDSYQDFVNGFAGTLQDTLSVVSVQGQSVQIQLDAEQTDGSHRYYAGTYTVSDGVIVGADVTQQ